MAINSKYFLHNGQVFNLDEFEKYHQLSGFDIYEVIRVMDGIPLFCEDHYERMMVSIQQSKLDFSIEYGKFEEQIKLLAKHNSIQNGNVRIDLIISAKKLILYFIPHYYPSVNEYKNGVKAGLFNAERINPSVKSHLPELKSLVRKMLVDRGLYELIYMNNLGEITEGSRSNIFFIKDETIYTCPLLKVLNGITRQKVIRIIKDLNINFLEEIISGNDLNKFDAVFLTGTSPKVLPISTIDEFKFPVQNKIMLKIMDAYNQMIENYICAKQAD